MSGEGLFVHQEDIARRIASAGRLGVFCEQGTGKTRAVLEGLLRLRDPWPCLVVCPVTVIGVWGQEARKWIGVAPTLVRGTREKRRQLLESDARIYVMGYESLRAENYQKDARGASGRKYKVTRNRVRESKPWRTVVADECSRVKHGTTSQSRALHAFSDVPYRIGMSGTPISHSPLDLWSEFRFIEPSLFNWNFRVFREPYVLIRRKPIPGGVSKRGFTHYEQIVAYRNVEQLYAKVAPHVVRYRKEDCLDLPEKLVQKVEVELSAEQRRVYEGLKDDMLADIGDQVVVAPNVLARLMRLQQVVQGYAIDEDGAIHRFDENPKLDALRELLERVCVESGRKAVVWCRFREDLDAACGVLADLGVGHVRVDGSVTGERRDQAVREFQGNFMPSQGLRTCDQGDGATRAFVGQIQAAGFGITLTAASYSIFYSQDWNLDDRLQAEDRSHRIGTRWPVTYVDVVARRTIDATIAENLRRKVRWARALDRVEFGRALDGETDGR